MSDIDDDRLVRAIAAVVRALAVEPRFYGLYEYEVTAGTGATGYKLRALAEGMSDYEGVKLWADSATGIVFVPGARVLVAFVNGDPGRPFIAHDGAIVRHGDIIAFPSPGSLPIVKVPPP